MKFFYKKNKVCGLIAICFVMMLSFQIVSTTTLNDPVSVNTDENPKISATITGTKQWLNNSGFDTNEDWYNATNTDIINPDVNSIIENGIANYEILGEAHTYSNINGTPTSAKGWTKSYNGQYPGEPNQQAILTQYGGYARHHWSDNSSFQQVAAQWDKQILMPHNMSDYVVTAASLNMTVNATVHSNPGNDGDNSWGGLEVSVSEAQSAIYYNVGDFIKYYVVLSDKDKTKNYTDVISYIPSGLGANHGVGNQYDYLYNTVIEIEDENDLIFNLNNLFHYYNNENITITIGMFLNCEDNWGSDDDFFDDIYITSVNFTFTYKKNINQETKISLNQDGQRLSELSPENYTVIATEANFRFDYKVDTDWASNTSSINSELRVLLNGYDHKITIKLTDVNLTYEKAFFELDPPSESLNISIEIYLRDEFNLDKVITISIDNVTLDISYIIIATDPLPPSDGGGGGTTIIRGEDYTPVVIGLVAGIIGLVVVFGAYQAHFKHPPMVRKIRKLKKKIKKGKTLKSLIVNPREEIIRDNFKMKTRHILDEEFLQSEVSGKIAKTPKNGKTNKIKEKGGK